MQDRAEFPQIMKFTSILCLIGVWSITSTVCRTHRKFNLLSSAIQLSAILSVLSAIRWWCRSPTSDCARYSIGTVQQCQMVWDWGDMEVLKSQDYLDGCAWVTDLSIVGWNNSVMFWQPQLFSYCAACQCAHKKWYLALVWILLTVDIQVELCQINL